MTEAELTQSTVSPQFIDQAVASLDKYILDHYGKPSRRTLRDRQMTVFEDLRDALKEGQTDGYVTLPTAVGKTVLFTEYTEALNTEQILETMIIVPTRTLVDQTEKRFTQFAPDIEVGKLYTYAHDITKPVTITTYSSLVRHINNGTLNPQLIKVLVLDEVHRSLSPKRIQVIAQFTNAIRLGFTATPMYSEDKQVSSLLNTEIHKMTIREAVEEDLLSSFSAIVAETEIDLTNISIKGNGDYDDKELEQAINIQSRNQAAIDLYLKLFDDQTAIAYCNSVKHAQDVAQLFSENGVAAGFVSGYQDRKEQAEILRRYHEGEIKVLCNADLLIEGFDEPRVSVCLNLRPTKSIVVAQQRAGRTLRKDPNDPNKHAYIVDFLDKTEDPKRLSVTFAEVAEAAQIFTKKKGSTNIQSININGIKDIDLGEDISEFEEEVINISGLKVITNPLEVMRIVKEIQEKQYQPAPEGWMHNRLLSEEVDIYPRVLKNIADSYRENHSEWFDKFLLRGRVIEFYSPELIEILIERSTGLRKDTSWIGMMALANELGKDRKTTKKILVPYKKLHPELFKTHAFSKQLRESYSPQLVSIIKDDQDNQLPPEGWITRNALISTSGKDHTILDRLIQPYRDLHPEWLRVYLSGNGKPAEFYSPELIRLLSNEINTKPKGELNRAPEGWLKASSIGINLSLRSATVREKADSYRKKHPEWFGTYKDERGNVSTFYSPELVSAFLSMTNKVNDTPPEGWMTIKPLSKIIHKHFRTAIEIVKDYQNNHPEWFCNFRASNNKTVEFYSPELVEQIKKDLGIDS